MVRDVIVYALVVVGVVVTLLSCLGTLVARDAYDRLHFTSPASVISPVCIALAIVIQEGPGTQSGIKAVLTAAILVVLNTVLVHAIARAARIREHGGWKLTLDEEAQVAPAPAPAPEEPAP